MYPLLATAAYALWSANPVGGEQLVTNSSDQLQMLHAPDVANRAVTNMWAYDECQHAGLTDTHWLCLPCWRLQASKLVRLMKSVAVTLNQHYPSRLQQLFFVEPPAVMKWPVQAAKPLLHADTGNKIQVCSLTDASLPVNLNRMPDSW